MSNRERIAECLDAVAETVRHLEVLSTDAYDYTRDIQDLNDIAVHLRRRAWACREADCADAGTV